MPLLPLSEYEELAAAAHGHLCAGQILGLRMALAGLRLLGLDDPRGVHRKRLITFIEIDRCVADAIMVATGCRLGKRALKLRDFGKTAAAFCDLETGRAVRVAALDSAKARADALHPELAHKSERQMAAYREMPDAELFAIAWVRVQIPPEDLPGFKAPRSVCDACGESVAFLRQVVRDGRTLCRACAGEAYYEPL